MSDVITRPGGAPGLKEALRQSEERYRLLVSTVQDYAIFLIDPTGVVLSWNAGAHALKGYSEAEILGQNFQIFYAPEDLARNHPQNELALALSRGRYEEEGWRIRKNGSRFWAHVVITKLVDDSGVLVGFAKVVRDLSERRRVETVLRESEEKYRLMVEGVKDYGIFMLDPTGHIASWNDGARALKGYASHEILGRHFSIFYEAADIKQGKCEYELLEATTTGRYEEEGWRLRKDGTRFWANVAITALYDANRQLRGFSKVTRDITERKRNEDRLRRAHENLEQKIEERTREYQKAIESRDEFLSIASHELKTPVTALKLQHQLFARELKRKGAQNLDPAAVQQMTALSLRQIGQLSRLIDDMLDASRIATGRMPLEMQQTDFSALVQEAADSFAEQLKNEKISLTLKIEPGLVIRGDALRLNQVISNLIGNAIKYGKGSPIEIRTFGGQAKVILAVKDGGPGIEAMDLERIFLRFERAVSANNVSGLGLGLYISRQIANAHGGGLYGQSEFGRGSTFILEIPG